MPNWWSLRSNFNINQFKSCIFPIGKFHPRNLVENGNIWQISWIWHVWHAWHQYDGLLCSYIILSYSTPCCIVSLFFCFRSELKILSFRSADNDDYAVKWFNWMKSDIGQMSILRLSYSWGAFGNRRQYRNHDEDDEGRHGKGKFILFRNGLN